jgi:hypothetical protein
VVTPPHPIEASESSSDVPHVLSLPPQSFAIDSSSFVAAF